MSHILLKKDAGGGGASGGTSVHADLSGLLNNDHPQYSLSGHLHTNYSLTSHTHDFSDITNTGHTHDYAAVDHTHEYSGLTNTGHTHTESEISDFGDYADRLRFESHTGDSSVHFTVASLGLGNYSTWSELDAHTGNTNIHFAQTDILFENIQNTGHTHVVDFSDVQNTGHTHTESDITDLGDYSERTYFESHTGDSSVHFTVASLNLGDYATWTELDSHTGDSSVHFTVASLELGQYSLTSHTHPFSAITSTGHSHTESDIADLGDYAERSYFESHTGDSGIHFTVGSLNLGDYATWTELDAHTGDSTVHFTVASLNLDQYTTDVEHDSHTGDSSIHFTEASIDFANIQNTGHTHTESDITDLGDYSERTYFEAHTGDTSTHFTVGSLNLDQYTTDTEHDAHTGDSSIHFTVASLNLGDYATWTELDAHTGDSSVHFTEASIDIANIVSAHTHSNYSDTGHTHTDFLVNNDDDETTGRLTASGVTAYSSGTSTGDIGILTGINCHHEWVNSPSTLDSSTRYGIKQRYDFESGWGYLGTYYGIRSDINVTKSASILDQPALFNIYTDIDGNGDIKFGSGAHSPIYFRNSNPADDQVWNAGFFKVNVFGGINTEAIAAWTQVECGSGSSAIGLGYKGYATSKQWGTGKITGVQGVAFGSGNSDYTSKVGLDATLLGTDSTPKEKTMGVRSRGHLLTYAGSIMATVSSVNSRPKDITTDHLDFSGNSGEIYAEGNVEIDGELFCDGNESGSITAVTGTYTAVDRTSIFASGTFTVTLPTASTVSGRKYMIKNTGAGTITISPNVDGASLTLPTQYDYCWVQSDGSNWYRIG